jgi:hypothetical protein
MSYKRKDEYCEESLGGLIKSYRDVLDSWEKTRKEKVY